MHIKSFYNIIQILFIITLAIQFSWNL